VVVEAGAVGGGVVGAGAGALGVGRGTDSGPLPGTVMAVSAGRSRMKLTVSWDLNRPPVSFLSGEGSAASNLCHSEAPPSSRSRSTGMMPVRSSSLPVRVKRQRIVWHSVPITLITGAVAKPTVRALWTMWEINGLCAVCQASKVGSFLKSSGS
jgi:hypothetical protein